ncbi:MAG: glutamate ligase domain-containing protein, partial [Chloroflexota bacterium]
AEGKRETTILDVRHIPATFEGRARVNVMNALAATAAAYASNVSLQTIRTGLRSFSTSFYHSPGRLNLMEAGGYRVIVDYCHNVPGMEQLTEFVRSLLPRRSVAMIAMPGDRRDEDMKRFAALAARTFDEIVIREDVHKRGREPGEAAEIIRQAVIATGMPETNVAIVLDEMEATHKVLSGASHDDLIVLLADHPEEVWNTVLSHTQSRHEEVAARSSD